MSKLEFTEVKSFAQGQHCLKHEPRFKPRLSDSTVLALNYSSHLLPSLMLFMLETFNKLGLCDKLIYYYLILILIIAMIYYMVY